MLGPTGSDVQATQILTTRKAAITMASIGRTALHLMIGMPLLLFSAAGAPETSIGRSSNFVPGSNAACARVCSTASYMLIKECHAKAPGASASTCLGIVERNKLQCTPVCAKLPASRFKEYETDEADRRVEYQLRQEQDAQDLIFQRNQAIIDATNEGPSNGIEFLLDAFGNVVAEKVGVRTGSKALEEAKEQAKARRREELRDAMRPR